MSSQHFHFFKVEVPRRKELKSSQLNHALPSAVREPLPHDSKNKKTIDQGESSAMRGFCNYLKNGSSSAAIAVALAAGAAFSPAFAQDQGVEQVVVSGVTNFHCGISTAHAGDRAGRAQPGAGSKSRYRRRHPSVARRQRRLAAIRFQRHHHLRRAGRSKQSVAARIGDFAHLGPGGWATGRAVQHHRRR